MARVMFEHSSIGTLFDLMCRHWLDVVRRSQRRGISTTSSQQNSPGVNVDVVGEWHIVGCLTKKRMVLMIDIIWRHGVSPMSACWCVRCA